VWLLRRRRLEGADPAGAGRRGEKLAVRHLRRNGFKILARNYRCPAGEADIVALDRRTRTHRGDGVIAFVEVKTRTSDRYTDPESAVDAAKRRRLRRVAEYYLAARHAQAFAVRFDVVSVVLPADGKARVRHIPGAFE